MTESFKNSWLTSSSESRRRFCFAEGPRVYSASEGKFLDFSLVEIPAYGFIDPAPDEHIRACDPPARDVFPTDGVTQKNNETIWKPQHNQHTNVAFKSVNVKAQVNTLCKLRLYIRMHLQDWFVSVCFFLGTIFNPFTALSYGNDRHFSFSTHY